MDYLKLLLSDYKNINDLIIKELKGIHIIYLETLADQNKINDYILKVLSKRIVPKDITKLLPAPNIKVISDYKDLLTYLNTGFAIIINKEQIIAIEVKLNLSRSISTPTTEATLYGPKEALIENIQSNIGLVKRRIKSNSLKAYDFIIGRYTKTSGSILYIDSICDIDYLNVLKNKLSNIDIDGISDVGELRSYLVNDSKNVFPGIKITERPDVISSSLLNGKLVILLDNSPYALILPSFLADFINPISDNYAKSININFVKILRLLCFVIAITVPGFYIATTTYNQETIPTTLLISIQNQRLSVPFPAILECIITLLICEILRESDIRFPSSYGSAISILGALILGDAAVSAGIVSPIMIIVAALSLISSMIFTDTEISDALRHLRFFCLFISFLFGLYGFGLSIIFIIIYLSSYNVLGKPYMYPIMPFDFAYIKSTLIKMKNNKRGKLLSSNRIKGDI